jgi:hypothetical protein
MKKPLADVIQTKSSDSFIESVWKPLMQSILGISDSSTTVIMYAKNDNDVYFELENSMKYIVADCVYDSVYELIKRKCQAK